MRKTQTRTFFLLKTEITRIEKFKLRKIERKRKQNSLNNLLKNTIKKEQRENEKKKNEI